MPAVQRHQNGPARRAEPDLHGRRVRYALPYRRERWDCPDGDFIDVDFVDGQPGQPMVVLFHGLEGSAASFDDFSATPSFLRGSSASASTMTPNAVPST